MIISLLFRWPNLLCHYSSYISKSSTEWSNFGSFIGGTISPIVSFFAFLALLRTINIQSDQLKASTEQIKQSYIFNTNQSELLEKQNFESSFFLLTSSLKEDRKDFDLSPFLSLPDSSIIEKMGISRIENPIGEQALFLLTDIYNKKLKNAKNESEIKEHINYLLQKNLFTCAPKAHINKIVSVIMYIFVNKKDEREIQFYLMLLFDFLSLPEKIIYAYMCLENIGSSDALIIKKYQLFKDIQIQGINPHLQLLFKKHFL